tara:strand:- start:297 stop:482 length:186 start_codon:yes stop_codon:yes gene_type:complete
MDTEKRTPQKMSSPDVELEIDLLEGQTSSPKKVKAIPVSRKENTGNKEFPKKEKRAQKNED